MEIVNHPFVVSLEYAFQTESKLFFVLKFMRGGELYHHLRKFRRFPERTVMFFAGQIVLAIEYLHSLGCLYRDLKPENVLFGEDGYIQVADFGLAK
jgi:serum/glucocorticoid-regulated kinase 2